MPATRLSLLALNPHDISCAVSAPEPATKTADSIPRAARTTLLLLAALIAPMPSALGQTLVWETAGSLVAGIDDLDGDGVPDVIVKASDSIVVHSGATGDVIWTFTGQAPGDGFGLSMANAGDVDNDGTSDIIVGASAGYVQVFSGSTGTVLHTFIGPPGEPQQGSQWGSNSVAGLGDVNLDGYDDVVVGARGATPEGMFNGGQATIFSGLTGDALLVFDGTASAAKLGSMVAGPGDVNGDGVPDLLATAPGGDSTVGVAPQQVFVFSGLDGALLHTFTEKGDRIAGAGDVNQDGYADVIVGDQRVPILTGEAWVFSGQDGSVLHRFLGPVPIGAFGSGVAGAGDVNGDGVPDLLVGCRNNAFSPSTVLTRVFSGSSGAPLFEFVGPGFDGTSGAGIGDVDWDGLGDVAIVRSGLVQVYSSPQRLPADPDLSTIAANPTDVDFLGESTITVTPKDSGGLNVGPGQQVYLQTTSGVMLGSVVDQGDGTYTQVLQAGVDSAPSMVSVWVNGPAISNSATVTPSIPQFIAVANADLPVAGGYGSFIDSQAQDLVYQAVGQTVTGGNPAKRYSYLEHKWTIDVPGGGDSIFFLNAHVIKADGVDDFDFAFSLDDISYSPMLTVADLSGFFSYRTFALPPGTSGVVYIRVTDTDQTPGNTTKDYVRIDHMGIASIGGATEVPADPSDLLATAFSSSRIDLTWTDNASTESGFDIEWSLDGSTWNVIDSVAANVTSYSDTGLVAQTEYFYRVVAFNLVGSSGPSNVASATTLPPGGDVDDVANGEIAVQGTVSGGFLDTQANDGIRESILERESGGKPAKRHSFLEHKWTIDVTGGSSVTCFVKAYHDASPDGDDFVFAYSTDDSSYVDMLTVTKVADDGTYQSFVLPSSTTGTVYIRVRDTDQTQGARDLDSVHVDHLYIRSEN